LLPKYKITYKLKNEVKIIVSSVDPDYLIVSFPLQPMLIVDLTNLLNLTPVEVILDENFDHVSLMRRRNKMKHPTKRRHFIKRKNSNRFLIPNESGQRKTGHYFLITNSFQMYNNYIYNLEPTDDLIPFFSQFLCVAKPAKVCD
jgi:hypothetical protein